MTWKNITLWGYIVISALLIIYFFGKTLLDDLRWNYYHAWQNDIIEQIILKTESSCEPVILYSDGYKKEMRVVNEACIRSSFSWNIQK